MMNDWLTWLAVHRAQWVPDVVLVVMVVVVVFNIYALLHQRRTLVELRRLLLIARQSGIERRPLVLSNGVGHRYNVTPRSLASKGVIGGEGDDH